MMPLTPKAAALLELLQATCDGLERAAARMPLLTQLEATSLSAAAQLTRAVLASFEARCGR